MTHFLITSTLSLGALLAVYYLLLQREKMHRFNRVYLLASIMFSMVLPFISIPVYKDAPAPVAQIQVQATVTPAPQPAPAFEAYVQDITPQRSGTTLPASDPQIDYTPYVLWGLYSVVALLLALRFVFNIRHLYRLASHNEKIKTNNSTLVLLDDCPVPYTFLQYIFISKEEYANRAIEQELLAHEATHVRQRHTLDILFIEALKTVLWFNPLVYIYKHAIQLNHEFLADESVLSQNNNLNHYRHLLLQRASPHVACTLASSFNFSITKKRFVMMTKTTTPTKSIVLKLALLPAAAALLFGLATQTIVRAAETTTFKPASALTALPENESAAALPEVNNDTETGIQQPADTLTEEQRRDAYYSGVQMVINDERDGTVINKPYEQLTREQRQRYTVKPYTTKSMRLSNEEFESIKLETDVITVNRNKVTRAELSKYKASDFAYHMGTTVIDGSLTETKEHSLYTRDFFEKNIKYNDGHHHSDTLKLDISKDGLPKGTIITAFTPEESRKYLEEYVYMSAITNPAPEYPGGLKAFHKAISDNFIAPAGIEGSVNFSVDFIVEKDGSMGSLEIQSNQPEAIDAARKAVAATGKWKPGILKDKPVRVQFRLPVTLELK